MPAKKPQPVYLEWEDHWSLMDAGWVRPDECDMVPLMCGSVGWIIKEDKHGVMLAANITGSGGISQCSYILKKCIKKRKRWCP